MLDPLIAIPGPLFLLGFWSLSLGLMILVKVWADQGFPPVPLSDPAALGFRRMALLRGGVNAVLRTLCFKLWKEGRLQIEESGRTTLVAVPNQTSQDRLESLIISACAYPIQPAELFRRLGADGAHLLEPDFRELERLGLLSLEGTARAWKGMLASLVLLYGVGGIKLMLGLMRDRPVGFLLVSFVLMPILFALVVRPATAPRLTRAGRRFLRDGRSRLQWTLGAHTAGVSVDAALLLGVALFGTSALAMDPTNAAFSRTFHVSSGGCSSGCGSGGDSSSSSGGDSGGGDGGGGGCGGCGGGGD